MSFVLTAGPQSYVRACPHQRNYEFTSDIGGALRFATEADALAYQTAEHPVISLGGRPMGTRTRELPDFPLYVLNIGNA